MEVLIQNGANLNSKDEEGDTPAHVAMLFKQAKAFELLKSKGADLSIKNKEGVIAADVKPSAQGTL
jgi:ankyrin repeat protein